MSNYRYSYSSNTLRRVMQEEEEAMKRNEEANMELHSDVYDSSPMQGEKRVRFAEGDRVHHTTVSAADEAAGMSLQEARKPTQARAPRLKTFEKNGDRTYSSYSPSNRVEVQQPQFHSRHVTSPIAPHLNTLEKNGDRTYSSYNPNTPLEDSNLAAQRIALLRQREPQAPRLTTLEKHGQRIYSSTGASAEGEMSPRYSNQEFYRDSNHVTTPIAPRLVTLEKFGDRAYSSYNPHSDDYDITPHQSESWKVSQSQKITPRAPRLVTLEKHGERLYSSYSNDSAPAVMSENSNFGFDSIPPSMRNPNKTTIQSPFNLRSSSRSRTRSSSPYRSIMEMEERSHEFKALPVPKSAHRSPRITDRQEKKYTKPVPFNLRSAQRAASPARSYHSHEQSHPNESRRVFVARRMPNLAYRSPRQREKHYTIPQPFHLHADNRISERTTESEHNESYRFIALPMPDLTYRPPSNHSEHAHPPTRPIGFKLGYERERELNPIPNMAHRYPPKPPSRESTEPKDFTFAYGGGEHQYSETWNQYPDDDFETIGRNQVIHYIETPEGINAYYEITPNTDPSIQEQAEFEQGRDHDGYNLSMETLERHYSDMHANSVELDKVTDSKEELFDSPIVEDESSMKERSLQGNLDYCEKDESDTDNVSSMGIETLAIQATEEKDDGVEMEKGISTDEFKDEEDKSNICYVSEEDNMVRSVNEDSTTSSFKNDEIEIEDGASPMKKKEGGHQEDPNPSKSLEEMERDPTKESIAHADAPIQDEEGEDHDMSSNSEEDTMSHDMSSNSEEDTMSHDMSSNSEEGTMSPNSQEDDNMQDLIALTNVPVQDKESGHQEDDTSSLKSQQDSIALSDAPSLSKRQQQEDIGKESDFAIFKAREPVEDTESGQSPQRVPVEDPESGFTNSFRQGWHRTIEHRDLTTKQEKQSDNHSFLGTQEQTYIPSVTMGEKKSKSRSLFKRNKKYSQMKKPSWRERLSRKNKAVKSDPKEASGVSTSFIDTTSPLEKKQENVVLQRKTESDDEHEFADNKFKDKELAGVIDATSLDRLSKDDNDNRYILIDAQESDHNWWCCDGTMDVMFHSQDSRDDE